MGPFLVGKLAFRSLAVFSGCVAGCLRFAGSPGLLPCRLAATLGFALRVFAGVAPNSHRMKFTLHEICTSISTVKSQ